MRRSVGSLALVVTLLLAGCSALSQPPYTIQAGEMQRVWLVFVPAGIAVYLIVGGLILWSALRYRRRDPQIRQAARFHDLPPLEIVWTVIPILIVIGLFLVTFVAESQVDNLVATPQETVEVVGFRWSWRFLYPQHHVAIEGTANTPPELVLPIGETTQINLRSSDVIHAFWVPAFLFKRDAVPGQVNAFDLSPTRLGTFPGRCAEYCGTYHAHMSFVVRIVSPSDYQRWLRARSTT